MFSTNIGRSNYVEIAKAHASLGVTTICPTIVTGPFEDMVSAIDLVADMCENRVPAGAKFGGIHIEGPFLDAEKRGGHALEYLIPPSVEKMARFMEAGRGFVKIVTIAPELPGALPVIDYLVEKGIYVSAGHTGADAAAIHRAAERGLRGVTHIFNGMDGLHNRVPGVAGTALSTRGLTVGIIADLLHVNPEVVQLTLDAKGPEHLYLTTDAVSPMGSNAASFDLYGVTVRVRDGGCYTDDGLLAGTATPLPQMVHNLCHRLGVGEREAVEMATSTPAWILNQGSKLGVLRAGVVADLVVFDDAFKARTVYVEGETIPSKH